MSNLFSKELKRSNYRLLGLVGQGQFGRVYCAGHRKKGHIVALKELDKLRFPTHKFLREMRFLLSLEHPNIVTLYALEHARGGRYLVMDYCEGGTLRSLIEEDIRLHPAQALKLVTDVLAGLDHAHSRGIIHCDIKPENILLTLTPAGWTARISDFGIAQLSRDLAAKDTSNTGSPAYMAPERFYGEYSYASDLYAVGILLFELLAGYRPFSGIPLELMTAHLNQAVKIPDTVPAVLQPLIYRALQKLPARRFRSAAEMLAAVETAAALDLAADWSDSVLLRPTQPLRPTPLRTVYEELLPGPVRQLVIVRENSDPNTEHSPLAPPAESLYQVFDHQIQRWRYPAQQLLQALRPEGPVGWPLDFLERANDGTDDDALVARSPRSQIHLPERLKSLEPLRGTNTKGCWAIAQRALYALSDVDFTPIARVDSTVQAWNLLLGTTAATRVATAPSAIVQFPQDAEVAIDPQGRWLATVLASPDAARPLQVGRLERSLRANVSDTATRSPAPSVPSRPLSLKGTSVWVQGPVQLIALDNRYFAAFCPLSPATPASPTATTMVQVLSWRGDMIARQALPIALHTITATPTPYRLLALEAGHETSVVLMDLKPFRMLRIGVDIVPKLLAASPWGYILMAADGQIVLLDQQGQIIGCIAGPASPTAIAPFDPYGLAIATWHPGADQQGQGHLHIVDLRQLDLDIVF